jgi:hypothetical protein
VNETYYAIQKAVPAMGTNNIDNPGLKGVHAFTKMVAQAQAV